MPEQSAHQTKRILIVDDDEKLLDLHAAVFREAGYDVMTASDGEAAWTLLAGAAAPPSVVLSGIRMPKMTGFELFQKMRMSHEFKSIPVALYSHQGMEEHRKMAEALGVERFIVRAQTSPGKIVEIVNQLILGSGRAFRLAFERARLDGADFVKFMDSADKTHFADVPDAPLLIVIEPQANGGGYRVHLAEDK